MTNPTKATDAAIRSAIATLFAQGVTPTAEKICAVTGGSKSTVLKQMRIIDMENQLPPPALPEQMEGLMRSVATSMWTRANELARKEIDTIRSDFATELSAVREHLESANKTIRLLQKEQDEKDRRIEGYFLEIAQQKHRASEVDSLKLQIQDLQNEVRAERIGARAHESRAAELRGELNARTTFGKRQATRQAT